MKVDLNDVIEAIEFENKNLTHYYNKETGIISYLESEETSHYKLKDVERLEDFEEWERELILSIKDIKENPKNYIKLPFFEEINETNMMIEFLKENVNILDESEISKNEDEKTLKELINKKGLSSKWYDFREEEERKVAINWCKKNGIEY